MEIEESVHYIERSMGWKIPLETILVLNKSLCKWVAQIQTTYLQENFSFWILVQYHNHFVLSHEEFEKLGQFIKEKE